LIFLFTDDAAHARLADLYHAFGALGPTFGAIIICRILWGKTGWRQITRQLSIRKMNTKAWLLAFSPFFYLLLALPIDYLINHKWFSWSEYRVINHLEDPVDLIYWSMPSFFYGIFEEPGWRGFLLPWLQKRFSAMNATIILSLLWFSWHIPSFFYRYDLSVPMTIGFAIGLFAGAVVLTFLYNYTRGSLLTVIIWHLTWDIVSNAGKEGYLSAIMSTIIMVIAVVILIVYKWRNLSPFPPTTLRPL
jgi:membrane protease YdiL (CAAX protease family)